MLEEREWEKTVASSTFHAEDQRHQTAINLLTESGSIFLMSLILPQN